MTNMNPTELIKSVDHAAAMDDRWLFIASLVVFGVFAWVVMRYFVQQHERMIEDHKQARDSYQESLRGSGGRTERGERQAHRLPGQQHKSSGGVPR